MTTFSNTESSVDLFKIEQIEISIGLVFPKEYKDHLLLYNGGQCFPNTFSFIENGKESESNIDWFLAIYDGDYDNLITYFRIYKLELKRLPTHLIPIAHDSGGNLICISCDTKDAGYVYFWDHEKEVNYDLLSDDNYSNLYLIETTFNKFIDRLR